MNQSDFVTHDTPDEHARIFEVPPGVEILVSDDLIIKGFRLRKVEKTFKFISSRIYESRHTSEDDVVFATAIDASLAKGYIPIDCSIFASKIAPIPFPRWICIKRHSLHKFDTGLIIMPETFNMVLGTLTWNSGTQVLEKLVDSAWIRGKTFVLTGKGPEIRSTLINRIKDKGGYIDAAVSGYTDFLVCEDPNKKTTKMKAALKAGIKIISYDTLYKSLTLYKSSKPEPRYQPVDR